MLDPGSQSASTISALYVLRLVMNFEVVACALFLWDYILTFGMEVDLVWKSKWNFMKGLYLFQRYLPFTDIMWLFVTSQMGGILTETGCRKVYYFNGVFMIVGLAASELVLTLRTWAVWKWNRRLSLILPILYIFCWGSCLIIMVRLVDSTRFGPPPYLGFKGCSVTYARQSVVLIWALLIIWDALLLMLMLVPAIQAYRYGGNTSLMVVVYRDGVVYYLYLFVLSCINLIVVKALPFLMWDYQRDYELLFALIERLVHPILTSRVLLHIRAEAGDSPFWSDGLADLNTIHFHDSDVDSS